jgi:uncharacterized membrane protein
MEETGYLTLVMNFLAPFLLGVAIAYLVITTRRRQQDPAAQNRTNRATEVLYEKEERAREAIEEPTLGNDPTARRDEDERRRMRS